MSKIVLSPHANFIPIVKELHSRGEHEFVTFSPQAAKMYADLDLPVQALIDMMPPEVRGAAFRESARVLSELINSSLPENTRPYLSEFFGLGMAGHMYSRLPDIIYSILALDTYKPDIILVHNDVEVMYRAAALWARNNNSKCLHVPHAVYIDNQYERGPAGTDIHDIVSATHIAVAGSYQEAWYRKRSADVDIRMVGAIQFDRIGSGIIRDKATAKHMLGIPETTPVVTYASSWRQDTNLWGCHDGIEQTFLAVLKAVEQLQGLQLLLKTHPNSGQDSHTWHVEQIKKSTLPSVVITPHHLSVVLPATDLLLAYGPSNIILEGAIFGTRLATTHGYDDDSNVIKIGNEPTAQQIANMLHDQLQKTVPDHSKFVTKYCGIVDGQAHVRVANYVEEIV